MQSIDKRQQQLQAQHQQVNNTNKAKGNSNNSGSGRGTGDGDNSNTTNTTSKFAGSAFLNAPKAAALPMPDFSSDHMDASNSFFDM